MSKDLQQTIVRDSEVSQLRNSVRSEEASEQSAELKRSGRGSAPAASGKKRKSKSKPKRKAWVTLLRWTVVPILLFWSIIAGLYVGYSVLGKQPGGEVFQVETWKHLYDLIFSNS
ncbi:hypothetical protein PaecuDRAFT_4054 [Paenibacillus curdlanolyticus YK9]|uniref:DNA-directed RNA polymerase subunit beta n=1 Tax=Paenibacillus curdlanolyticus YK9 TaxID=717606 RepID=E0IEG3_9BACL|nr:DNA-directed RNA polymerase subunit beta [Paenibacillus curdlanolyticus]EFM09051.1 hypothetical protein PaecuDRAFT_4054 [Paenibacillus curdlanolyticus YK9]